MLLISTSGQHSGRVRSLEEQKFGEVSSGRGDDLGRSVANRHLGLSSWTLGADLSGDRPRNDGFLWVGLSADWDFLKMFGFGTPPYSM